MNSKDTRRITDAICQFKVSSFTIEKELSEWESQEDSERDLLIFFMMGLAAYKATLLELEEAIGETFDVDLSQITEGLSRQKDVMRLLRGDDP